MQSVKEVNYLTEELPPGFWISSIFKDLNDFLQQNSFFITSANSFFFVLQLF